MSSRLPTVTPKQVMRALEQARFFVHHVRGSHYYLKHPDRPEDPPVPVPFHARDLKRGLLHRILKQARLTPEEFLDLL